MPKPERATSARYDQLLDLAYGYVIENGIAELSLRPLATAIGTSPRVLLFLFGSKDGLLQALLARARTEELQLLRACRPPGSTDLATCVRATWTWLATEHHRALLTLWFEAYARSLVESDGPWSSFARETVADWLEVLASAQPRRNTKRAIADRTLALAVLRGALLDLLATGDVARTTLALDRHLQRLAPNAPAARASSAHRVDHAVSGRDTPKKRPESA